MAVLAVSNRDYSSLDRVAFCGDWHGNLWWAKQKIHELGQAGVKLLLHVGDFGFWSGEMGKRYLKEVDIALAEHDMEMFVCLGNHENWARAEQLWENVKRRAADGSKLPIQITERVQFLPRGWRFELNGVSFMSFAGAASIDFETRTKDRDWWTEELPTHEDVAHAVAGGPVDVMIAHETVDAEYAVGSVQQILASNPMGWSLDALSYSAVSRKRVTNVFEAVKPKLYVHGHMHAWGSREIVVPGADHSTMVVSLDMDQTRGNSLTADLETLRRIVKAEDFPRELESSGWPISL